MVIGTLYILSHDVYTLIDPGYILSFVIPLVAGKSKRTPKLLVKLFEVSILLGESIITRECIEIV